MKIKLNKIFSNKFQVRDQLDQEHLDNIAESLEKDGQWHPIIVRPTNDGNFDLIAGHYRYAAAKKIGWDQIEATVKDTDDVESRILALKTNLMSRSMTEIEEAKILKFLMEKDGLNQTELARKIGKSNSWVSTRLALVLKIHDDVKNALTENKINFEMIPVIGTLEMNSQPKFLKLLLKKGITNSIDARKLRDRYLNDTIFTIGFMGKKIFEFLNILKDNEVKTVIDIRYNTMSQYKADFNQDVLKRELKRDNIEYIHFQNFGVPPVMRDVVIAGYDSDCFRKWYKTFIAINQKEDFKKFLQQLKDLDKSVLLCSEEYSKPTGTQKHFCHRDFLADLIIEYSKKFNDETYHFNTRADL
ncbi:MAG: ParB/RepB/Spo0J family partition protein [Candidatus Hodarchaeota archaeon]